MTNVDKEAAVVHEEAVIRRFVRHERCARYLKLLETTKGREKLRSRLPHLTDLDRGAVLALADAEQTPASILRVLRTAGAPDTCYAISENTDLDGRLLPLAQALKDIVGCGFGTILSCIPGELAFFEGEEAGSRCLLRRPRALA